MPETGEECCCAFFWEFPLDDIADTEVRIVLEDVDAGMEATVDPQILPEMGPGEVGSFDLCVLDDHPIGASLIIVFEDVTSTDELGRYEITYTQRCSQVRIEPIESFSPLWSPDCDEGFNCCCTYQWLVPREADGENVVIRLDDVDDSLEPVVITPPVLNEVVMGEYATFQVCVDQAHTIASGLNLVFLQEGGTDVYSRFRLHYGERCRGEILIAPQELSQPQTVLYSPDCGQVPQCCCTFTWTNEGDPGAGTRDFLVRIPPGGDLSLGATVTPDTFTGVGGATPITFDVCVDVTHVLGAGLTLEIVEQPGGTVVATMPLRYDSRCSASTLQPTGEGGWELLFCSIDD